MLPFDIEKVTVTSRKPHLAAKYTVTIDDGRVPRYPRGGSQFMEDRINSAFYGDLDSLRGPDISDERIGAGIVLSTVWRADEGILAYEDAYEILFRMFPTMAETLDDGLLAATVYALDHRLPHSFRIPRSVSYEELRALRDEHEWVGEMSAFTTQKDFRRSTRLWFSDELAAVSARMLL